MVDQPQPQAAGPTSKPAQLNEAELAALAERTAAIHDLTKACHSEAQANNGQVDALGLVVMLRVTQAMFDALVDLLLSGQLLVGVATPPKEPDPENPAKMDLALGPSQLTRFAYFKVCTLKLEAERKRIVEQVLTQGRLPPGLNPKGN